jgi:hypothetical protein
LNILDATQGVLIASAVTQALFQTNLYQFITGQTDVSKYGYGSDGARTISLPELLGIGKNVSFGGNYGSSSFQEAVGKNFEANWGKMAMSVIGIPIIFSAAKKLLRKPVLTPANRLLKQVGLTGVKL